MLISKQGVFKKTIFANEEELESVVKENYRLLFGDYSIYIPQKTISTSGGYSTTPEAIVLNLKDRKWYIVEVELANHGVWGHIVPQITKQLVAVERFEIRAKLVDLFTEKVKESNELKEKFKKLGISELDIRRTIEEVIMEQSPTVIVPIDYVSVDLENWAKRLKNEVWLLEIEKYTNEQTQEVIYRIPEYISSPPAEEGKKAEERGRKKISRREFLARCEKPAEMLFTKLEEIAKERNYIRLEPTMLGFSFRIKAGSDECVLLTIYPDSFYIQKLNLVQRKGFKAEAVDTFVERIKKISQLAEVYERMTQPKISLRPADISVDDINTFVEAIRDLVDSVKFQRHN